jgi:hypothetical protein
MRRRAWVDGIPARVAVMGCKKAKQGQMVEEGKGTSGRKQVRMVLRMLCCAGLTISSPRLVARESDGVTILLAGCDE